MSMFWVVLSICVFGLACCAALYLPILYKLDLFCRPSRSRIVTAFKILGSSRFRSKVAAAWHSEKKLAQNGGLLADHEKNMPRVKLRMSTRNWNLPASLCCGFWRFFNTPQRLALILFAYLFVCGLGSYAFWGQPGIPANNDITRHALANANHIALRKQAYKLDKALTTNETNAKNWQTLGQVRLKLDQYELAVEAFRRAISLGQNISMTHASLGEALTLEANGTVTAEAQRHFEQALRRNRRNVVAIYYLGLARLQHHNPRTAIGLWKHIMRLMPLQNPWANLARERIAETAALNGLAPDAIKTVDPARAARGFR